MSNELAVFDWAREADKQLCFIFGGSTSQYEYYEDGEYKEDMVNRVLRCYQDALSYYSQYRSQLQPFLTNEDIEENTMEVSAEAVNTVVNLHFYNNERFEKERSTFSEDEIEQCLSDLETEVWECESCSYSPYYFSDVVYDILKDYKMSYICVDASEREQGITAFLNDAQNMLIEELASVGKDVVTTFGDPYMLVRYPKTVLELGSEKR